MPFNTLRMYVMGVEESRARVRATDEEIKQMREIQLCTGATPGKLLRSYDMVNR